MYLKVYDLGKNYPLKAVIEVDAATKFDFFLSRTPAVTKFLSDKVLFKKLDTEPMGKVVATLTKAARPEHFDQLTMCIDADPKTDFTDILRLNFNNMGIGSKVGKSALAKLQAAGVMGKITHQHKAYFTPAK